jgi:hypothetical protein
MRISVKSHGWVRVQGVAVVPFTNALVHTPVDMGAIELTYTGTKPPLGHRRRLQEETLASQKPLSVAYRHY